MHSVPFDPMDLRRFGERLLWAVTAVSIAVVLGSLAFGRVGEARALARLEAAGESLAGPADGARPEDGAVLGSLEVPRLELRAAVFEGTAESSLLRGAGHVRGTAFPGESGNVALAAHRDLHFRALRHVRPGDLVRLTSTAGRRVYAVEGTRVVLPSETSVLADDGSDRLTLITCYPFGWIGNAPRRFVVTARRVAAGPETIGPS